MSILPLAGRPLKQLRTVRNFCSSCSRMGRSYNDAIAALNTLQSNFATVDAIRKSGRGMNKLAIPEMIEWCRRIRYEPSDLDRLRPIHIAGTKGKGSTSAFISSILAQYLAPSSHPAPLHKVGLYTSPHLRFVRERIQINNEPISEELFAKYFFETWDRLEDAAAKAGQPTDRSAKPVYFRFLTLMAFHTYMSEGVDSAVIECGIGGEHDSTNIIERPTVAGITSLGIDHVAMLGETIEEIAWHKAGIMKPGAPAFTVPQPEAALDVLKKRAAEKGVTLHIVQRHPELETIELGLAADFQKTNASLAIAVAAAHLRALGYPGIPDDMSKAPLPQDSDEAWSSIEGAAKWFASEITSGRASDIGTKARKRVLIFNQQTRDAGALAKALHKTLATALENERPFTHAVFCTNITFQETGYKADLISVNANAADVEELSVQKALGTTWHEIDPETEIKITRTIEEAVAWVRDLVRDEKEEVKVLVTGSLHLVGGFLEVLETQARKGGF